MFEVIYVYLILYINSLVCLSVTVHQHGRAGQGRGSGSSTTVDGWCAGGCWITLAQCDPMETSVQASSGWMVRRWVLNHSGPVWSPVFSSNPKNPVLGFHGWDETAPQGSVYLVSSFFFLALELFSYHAFFFSLLSLFSWAFFFSLFFLFL